MKDYGEKVCEICGMVYKRTGPTQKYCPACAHEGKLIQTRKHYREIVAPKRKIERQEGQKRKAQPQKIKRFANKPVNECKRNDCKYHPQDSNPNKGTCDYILLTGRPRGCPVKNCNKYKRGKHPGKKALKI